MTFADLRHRVTGSLRTRVVLLTLAVFVAVAVPAYVAFHWIVDTTIVKLGTLFAEKQVLFDRYRGLEALIKEVSLADLLTRSPVIHAWAADEKAADKKARALAELEQFRLAFKDKSYFFVVNDSGDYYFNDAQNSYAGNQLRYALHPDNPRDGWYYKTVSAGPGCQLNVDHDDNLNVTKVWINCPVMEGSRVLGVIGTGVDLTEFIHEVVALPQVGVHNMFVDRNGAIQAHRDAGMVDFHSLTKDTKAKKTIFLQLDRAEDRAALSGIMGRLAAGRSSVESRFMHIGGREMLVGIAYLDQIGWYNVTLMDLDQIIDRRLFAPIAALLAIMVAAAVTLMTLLFKRSVLDRLARLETAARRVQEGDFAAVGEEKSDDEIGRLSRSFAQMAKVIGDHTELLEETVRERTEQLRRLAHIDTLTDIYNRRGFVEAFEREKRRAGGRGSFGLLLIDMDLFKSVNDGFGHHGGDAVLVETARRLKVAMRPYDICARWGGDEFIVLLADCEEAALARVARKVLAALRAPIALEDGRRVEMTISLGACVMALDETLDAAVGKADAALYAAKGSGRDRMVLFDAAVLTPRFAKTA